MNFLFPAFICISKLREGGTGFLPSIATVGVAIGIGSGFQMYCHPIKIKCAYYIPSKLDCLSIEMYELQLHLFLLHILGCQTVSKNPLASYLSRKDHFQVTQFLEVMTNEQLIEVGLGLGLLYIHLKRMHTLLHDMVDAWLNEEDSVTEKSGPPSWTSLMTVLEEVGMRGIAVKIRSMYIIYSYIIKLHEIRTKQTKVPNFFSKHSFGE